MVSVSQEAALIFNNKQAFQVFLLTEDPTKTDKLKSNFQDNYVIKVERFLWKMIFSVRGQPRINSFRAECHTLMGGWVNLFATKKIT